MQNHNQFLEIPLLLSELSENNFEGWKTYHVMEPTWEFFFFLDSKMSAICQNYNHFLTF